jgi:peptidoglycan/LPS O-acetylase OafA/YrhL
MDYNNRVAITSERILAIDGFRGWAALAVLLVHTQFVTPAPLFLKPFVELGAVGVQLFFIVSAFTIFQSLETKRHNEQNYVLRFFVRRFFRIAPLFYAVMVICILAGKNGPQYWAPEGASGGRLAAIVFFLNGFRPDLINAVVPGCWSIAVEVGFYCLAPLIFVFVKTWRHALAFVSISFILGKVLGRICGDYWLRELPEQQHYLVEAWRVLSLPNQLYVFGLGIAIYKLQEVKTPLDQLPKKWIDLALLGSVALLVLFGYFFPGKLSVIASLLSATVFFGIRGNNKILTARPITFLGRISYSLYLLHFLIFESLPKFNYQGIFWPIAIIAAGFVVVPCAWLSYELIELPALRFCRRFLDGHRGVT